MHYYQFNIADYANSTQHLEPMEDLAYRRMLDLYYMKERSLPLELSEIARLIRMRSHTECIAVVLQDFFIRTRTGYVNITADEVLGGIYKKSEKARAAANARWSKIKELEGSTDDANALRADSDCNANGMLPITHNPIPNNKDKSIEQNALLEDGFEIFYTAGLVKKSKLAAFKTFKSLCKAGKFEPSEFGGMLANDVRQRISLGQFGIDKLHPSTYLNQHRWTDEKTNDGIAQATGKQSAAERITARNNAKYGQPSGGLGLAEGRGDLRGAMDQGERGITFDDVGSCIEQDDTSGGENWDQGDY
jgi:uncharacterized protein YdaU (DUF1376 family)